MFIFGPRNSWPRICRGIYAEYYFAWDFDAHVLEYKAYWLAG